MRERGMFGCPTGEIIRELVQNRFRVQTDTSIDADLYGVLQNIDMGEQTVGVMIIVSDDVVSARLCALDIDGIEVCVTRTEQLLDSDAAIAPMSGLFAQHNQGRAVQVYALADVEVDLSLRNLDRLTVRDWERRNQPSSRPSRHSNHKKHRQK